MVYGDDNGRDVGDDDDVDGGDGDGDGGDDVDDDDVDGGDGDGGDCGGGGDVIPEESWPWFSATRVD